MDAENGGVFFGQNEEDVAVEGCLGVDGPFSVHDGLYTATQETLEEWVLEPHCVHMDEMQGLNDSDPEDVLHAINPNDVYPSAPPGESPSESDSGISEDPRSDTPPGPSESIQGSSTVYQVVYDISSLSNIKKEPEQRGLDVISIELDEWNAHMLMSDSCIVNELPLLPSAKPVGEPSITVPHKDAQCLDSLPLYPDLLLTDEEQKLLNQEGISLPNNLPLTKAEERILKKVRRKIRNKQSAQDSRRRKKEYIDGLEGRVAACAAQNHELQKTVEQLEKHNMSLLAQLRRLQTLIKQTATKAAQTSTCIMIFLFSLALIIFPSYSPFSWGSVPVEDGYAPAGVISRNILTDPASSLQILEDVDDTVVHQEVLVLPPDLDPSNPKDLATTFFQQPNERVEEAPKEGAVQGKSETGNDSTLMEGRIDSLPVGLMSSKGQGSADIDSIKAAHADEM